jgi:heme-degrading monooxygenase HmoA
MPFAAMNVIAASPEDVAEILADIARLGFAQLHTQPGFRLARTYKAETGSEVVTITEWESREAFMAYRQSDAARELLTGGRRWHPKISFYEIVSETAALPIS